jgi:hypothetical protein
MDNASNNDTVLVALKPTKQTRLHYLGHIISLVVKASLFGTKASGFQEGLREANDDDAFRLWHQHEAVGHRHSLVTYIMRSESLTSDFEATQKDVATELIVRTLHLKRESGVRWISTYYMIKRAFHLQPALQKCCRDW